MARAVDLGVQITDVGRILYIGSFFPAMTSLSRYLEEAAFSILISSSMFIFLWLFSWYLKVLRPYNVKRTLIWGFVVWIHKWRVCLSWIHIILFLFMLGDYFWISSSVIRRAVVPLDYTCVKFIPSALKFLGFCHNFHLSNLQLR